VRFLHSKVIDLYSKQNFNTEMFLSLLLGIIKYLYLPVLHRPVGEM